jgi:Concanavalin A-like lectin/glucanases superfamily/Glycosyl hydrolases family 2, sugar binding domain/Glycosyl hydrolases family 2
VFGVSNPSGRTTRRVLTVPTAAVLAMSLMPGTVAATAQQGGDGWQRKTPPLSTPWTMQVGPDNALPEYPRPQLTRGQWQNLNGVWQFASATAGETPPFGQDLAERILVPYPVESALSGIRRHEQRMWYRRTLTVPASWRVGSGQRLMLNFGAVDYDATVYINGVQVAHHLGGYNAFSVDVTDALRAGGPQELLVGVYDPTDAGGQPIGKQRNNPGGIFYTSTSGIWQTVWMEPVSATHVTSVDMTPDLGTDTLHLTVNASGNGTVTATAIDGAKPVGTVTGSANTSLALPVPNAKLWSPERPFLYNLQVVLRPNDPGAPLDDVGSYFGMRSVGAARGADGRPRLVLNGKPIFAMATLDQGFWPDGIYTAPTDAALRFDLQQHKALGFNAVRKHIKVEPARWYYWADRLGLLVWQDMPAMNLVPPSAAAQAEYLAELHATIEQHKSETSIIGWIPFNEGWGEFDPVGVAAQVKAWDPSRLVDADSGVNCCLSFPDSGEGNVYDDHTYVGPGAPPFQTNRIAIDGEYGGLGLEVPGHLWPGTPQAYEMEPDSATLTRRYVELAQKLLRVQNACAVSGGIYTQITDVENEVNGLLTYDRQVEKMGGAQVRNANLALERNAQAAFDGTNAPVYPPGQTDPVGTWTLDEGSGAIAHDSADSHDLSLVGAATWVPGESGTALQFDGSSQYAQASGPILDTAGNFSVAAWVKLDSTGHFATAVSQDGASASAFFLQYSAADNRWAFSTVEGRALSDAPPTLGQWTHLVGVHDANSGTYTLYVNGQGQAKVLDQCLGDGSSGPLAVGRGFFGGNKTDFFPGTVDQAHVWNRALSAADVTALYQSGQ